MTGSHAVIEAGTGTGKTLAYLVPAVLAGKRVVVSTATKALQEQLVEKDLPLLQKMAGNFSYAVMKGRQNYLCILRQEQFDANPTFVSRDEANQYKKLRTWAATTTTGDRAELDLPEGYTAWRDVSSTSETCLGEKCSRYGSCHVVNMKRRAAEADVIVVNHHLFFADLSVRKTSQQTGAEVIPRYEAVIVDEAHNMEEIATEFFGSQVSNWRVLELCQDVDRAAKSKTGWPLQTLADATRALGRAASDFFDGVAVLAPAEVGRPAPPVVKPKPVAPPPPKAPQTLGLFDAPKAEGRELAASDDQVLARARILELKPDNEPDRREARWTLEQQSLQPLSDVQTLLLAELDVVQKVFDQVAPEGSDPELDAFRRRASECRAALQEITAVANPEYVHWAEVRGKGVFLRAAPVDVASPLREALFELPNPVIMTSATLATGGDTSFFRRRIGLLVEEADVRPTRELILPSPFDYEHQAAIYVPRHLPEPNDEAFLPQAIEEIAALIALAKGRTFVLFTSLRAMKEVHRLLGPRVPYRVLVQGQKPKGAILRDFREEPSVLFATQSFWEGVDIQGDALSMVVIDKLPFASPGDPLLAARMKAITDRGGSPFQEYQLPSAAISLKQGFGRLIRSRADTGAVAILDHRLWTKGYGSFFFRSLPACPTFDRFPDVKRWWKEVRTHE
jgi:ATP-dependent DNA helicase DinG